MAAKKISFIELHWEKMLAAGAGVALVGVLVWELVLSGTSVKVGSESLSIGDFEEKLTKQGQSIERKLNGDLPEDLKIPQRKSVSSADEFAVRRDAELVAGPLPRNRPWFGGMLTGLAGDRNVWFYEPKFVAPKAGRVLVTRDAFDASAIAAEDLQEFEKSSPKFVERFLKSESADVTWATPTATIPLKALWAELQNASPSDRPPRERIKAPWTNGSDAGGLMIVDVVFERRQRKPDGSWGNPVEVAPVVGALSYRSDISSATVGAASLRDSLTQGLSDIDAQMDILHPPLLPMKGGYFIEPAPTSGAAGAPVVDPVVAARQRDERKIAAARAQVERTAKQLEEKGGRLDPPPPGSNNGAGDSAAPPKDKGGGGAPPGMGGGGSMKKEKRDAEGQEANKAARIALTKKLDREKASLKKLEEAFAKAYPEEKFAVRTEAAPEPALRDRDELVVWTHDFDVQDGATYQYRAKVVVFNPFFTRRDVLVKEQQPLDGGPGIASAVSAWGSDITIEDATQFFLVRGSARDGVGGRRVTVELFRYIDGVVRTTTEDVLVGDPVGKNTAGKSGGGDFRTPYYLTDIFDDGADGLIAVFEAISATGQSAIETRTLSDKESEAYREFRDRSAAASPKKVAAREGK